MKNTQPTQSDHVVCEERKPKQEASPYGTTVPLAMVALALIVTAIATQWSGLRPNAKQGLDIHTVFPRPIDQQDVDAMFTISDSGLEHLPVFANPGVRVDREPLVYASEQQPLLKELKQLVDNLGFESGGQLFRVTALQEYERSGKLAPVAPWGYGENFDLQKFPEYAPLMRAIAERAWSRPSYGLRQRGFRLRDITINYYPQNYYSVLRPHIDPLTDGEEMLVCNILSNAVLTFTPKTADNKYVELRDTPGVVQSWSKHDFDIPVTVGSAIHFREEGRYQWAHGIRPALLDSNTGKVTRWYGSPQQKLPIAEERYSLVFSFGSANFSPPTQNIVRQYAGVKNDA